MNVQSVRPTVSRAQDLQPAGVITVEPDPFEAAQHRVRVSNLVLQGNNPSRLNVRRGGSDTAARLEIDFPDMVGGVSEAQVRFGRNTVPTNIRFQLYQGSTICHELNTQAPGSSGYLVSTLCRQGQALLIGGTTITGGATSVLCIEVQSPSSNRVARPWPVMTTSQRDAISAPPVGSVIFNSSTNKLNIRGATAWEVVNSS